MKKFVVPEVDVVYFEQKDVIATSTRCEDCGVCPEGKDNCPYVDDL